MFLIAYKRNKILLALIPNLKDVNVSVSLYILGLHVTINVVLLLPPKLSYNILVNFEFLYGIN